MEQFDDFSSSELEDKNLGLRGELSASDEGEDWEEEDETSLSGDDDDNLFETDEEEQF